MTRKKRARPTFVSLLVLKKEASKKIFRVFFSSFSCLFQGPISDSTWKEELDLFSPHSKKRKEGRKGKRPEKRRGNEGQFETETEEIFQKKGLSNCSFKRGLSLNRTEKTGWKKMNLQRERQQKKECFDFPWKVSSSEKKFFFFLSSSSPFFHGLLRIALRRASFLPSFFSQWWIL